MLGVGVALAVVSFGVQVTAEQLVDQYGVVLPAPVSPTTNP